MSLFQNLFISVSFSLVLLSCGSGNEVKPPYHVEHKGALKNMMHKGDLSAKADLADFNQMPHLYALGAVNQLKGEIQIFDGRPLNTEVIDGRLSIDSSFSKQAALLVYAEVANWLEVPIPKNVTTHAELEEFVELTAEENEIDTDEPFPFMLEGKVSSFDWHVINWKDGDTEHSHEKHIKSGLHGTKNDMEVEMLGFYSDAHHAIFTHHTTNMHIHVRSKDHELAGHVDDLTLGSGMILKLPLN